MLRSAQEIKNYVLLAKDGEIGRCKDFLFDDHFWTIRYMVANTGKWLPGRKVLISPISLGEPDWVSMLFPVRLKKEQIEDAPGLDEDAPVSKQYEKDWLQYYGWAAYWGGPNPWGFHPYPGSLYETDGSQDPSVRKQSQSAPKKHRDAHLRSIQEVSGYHIQALDRDIGHVENFLIHDKTWTIRYMVVDTRNWLPGKKVIVAPAWVKSVNWEKRFVEVDLTREQIETSPEYTPLSPVERLYEERLHDHYGRPKYWDST